MVSHEPLRNARKNRKIPSNIPNIFLAAEANDVKALDLALEHYDVNDIDESGMTPLHYAASTLAKRTRDRLLSHPDIDPTLADKFGRSAATVAMEAWGHLSDWYVEDLNRHCYPWLYDSPEDGVAP